LYKNDGNNTIKTGFIASYDLELFNKEKIDEIFKK